MNKPDLSDSELAKSGLANSDLVKQAIAFVEDYAAFAASTASGRRRLR
jgi:hypothetical protein